jgi:hypothetical protein
LKISSRSTCVAPPWLSIPSVATFSANS